MDFAARNYQLTNSKNPTTPLTLSEEKEMIQRYKKGDLVARRRLIEANIRFVVKLALQYQNQGLELADLIQEGNLGLIEALEKFDSDKECRLITYAAWWIRLYLQRAIEQKSRQVNLPINKLDLLRKVKAFEHKYVLMHGRKPYNDEIADSLDIEPEKIDELEEVSPSFHTIHGQDENHPGLERILIDESIEDTRDTIWLDELKNRMDTAMKVLNPREREVLTQRYGLLDEGKKLSLRKVGRNMGLSAEGVRRIEEQAMNKLRRPMVISKMQSLLTN